MEKTPIHRFIDHTLLKPTATSEDIRNLCREAEEFNFYSVCVHGCWTEAAYDWLIDSNVKVATVVGFPLGAMESDVKRYEAEAAIDAGAEELDCVLNIGWLKEGRDVQIVREIRDIVEIAEGRALKIILETGYLSAEEIKRGCQLALQGEAQFVKTSTGFGPGAAKIEDIRLMRETVGQLMGVKASGGIRDYLTAKAMLDAGANRIGTSAGLAIVGAAAQEEGSGVEY